MVLLMSSVITVIVKFVLDIFGFENLNILVHHHILQDIILIKSSKTLIPTNAKHKDHTLS